MSEEEVVQKRKASSGRVDYTQPIVIRGGSKAKTHFEVFPTFVPRSNGTEDLNLKFSYWKKTDGAYRTGFPADFTLTPDEVSKLRECIDRCLGMAGSADGKYLMIKLDDAGNTNIQGKNAADVGAALLKLLTSPGINKSVADIPNSAELVEGLQAAIRIRSLSTAIAELEEALNTGINEESFYQDWCETNAWAFGNAYTMRDDVRDIALGDSVDILVQRTTDQFRDIFELKRPDHLVVDYDKSHKSHHWSRETTKTIGQCHRYIDALHEGAAQGLRDHPEIIAYYPYSTIVIGRSNDWSKNRLRALHGLNSRLHSIRVITYDHLLEQAKRALAIVTSDQ